MKRQTIFTGVSGGVDSAVSAALLQAAGHRVVAVFLESWSTDFGPSRCSQAEDRRDAARVASTLGLPFVVLPCADQYRQRVLQRFLSEIQSGRTPNPDALCNAEIKFNLFLDAALGSGADAIATGHYARLTAEQQPRLQRGVDRDKDQSYFLARVPRDRFRQVHFPVGGYTKHRVRQLAHRFHLPVADKKDSQGLCFVGTISLPSFLGHFFASTPGPVALADGTVIGEHRGLPSFTIGQRHGFGVGQTRPLYVVAKRQETNALIVSATPSNHARRDLKVSAWMMFDRISSPRALTAQLRYRQPAQPLSSVVTDGSEATITFADPQSAATPGQILVVYDHETVVASGILA